MSVHFSRICPSHVYASGASMPLGVYAHLISYAMAPPLPSVPQAPPSRKQERVKRQLSSADGAGERRAHTPAGAQTTGAPGISKRFGSGGAPCEAEGPPG